MLSKLFYCVFLLPMLSRVFTSTASVAEKYCTVVLAAFPSSTVGDRGLVACSQPRGSIYPRKLPLATNQISSLLIPGLPEPVKHLPAPHWRSDRALGSPRGRQDPTLGVDWAAPCAQQSAVPLTGLPAPRRRGALRWRVHRLHGHGRSHLPHAGEADGHAHGSVQLPVAQW